MKPIPVTARYNSFSIGLHWLMLVQLIAVYACIELRELYPKGSDPREALKTWHFMLGLSVFVLVFSLLSTIIVGIVGGVADPARPLGGGDPAGEVAGGAPAGPGGAGARRAAESHAHAA